jgi:hypothetical protein
MKRSRAVLVILLTLSAIAQTDPRSKKAKTPELPKWPVSKYMRKIGVLYLALIDESMKQCHGFMSKDEQLTCNSILDSWDEHFQPLERDVGIELSDSSLVGDVATWRLLKNVKLTSHVYLSGMAENNAHGNTIMKQWADAKAACRVMAEEVLFGKHPDSQVGNTYYIDDGGCRVLIDESVKSP